jgi:hypothetical protein
MNWCKCYDFKTTGACSHVPSVVDVGQRSDVAGANSEAFAQWLKDHFEDNTKAFAVIVGEERLPAWFSDAQREFIQRIVEEAREAMRKL